MVVSPRAAKDINKDKYVSVTCALFFTPQGDPRLGSDSERADGGLKARAAGTVCLQTRAVVRRRFQPFGRRHRNRSGGFCCFSLPKSREKRVFPEAAKGLREVFCCFSPPKSREKEKVFSCTFGAKSTKSLRTSFSAGACDPRRCTGRARSSLCATPWRTRRSPHPLFPRQTRVRTGGAASGGSIKQIAMHSGVFFPAWRVPTWFRWRKSGRRAESESGGDGLLANPRSRPTPLSGVRTSTSESVRWLLLLFATEKQRKKSFSESCKRTSRGFLLLFAAEKQRKKVFRN